MTYLEMKKRREEALAKAESLVAASEQATRQMTETEVKDFDASMKEANELSEQIKRHEAISTLRTLAPKGQIFTDAPANNTGSDRAKWQNREYRNAVSAWLASRGRSMSEAMNAGLDDLGGFKFPGVRSRSAAANYEGGADSGAPLFPTAPVDANIIPLAPPEIGVEALCTVVPTTMDLPMSRKKAHGTAAFKAEGDGTGVNVFTGTSPTTEKFTLSAYMIGHPEDASWELLQDVNTFQAFLTEDILLSIAVLKDAKYVKGSGVGEPEGIEGNVGAGVTAIAAGADVYASELLDATLTVLGKLNAAYHARAGFLMNRATSIIIRKAQKTANLFEPVFVRTGGVDYLHGYRCEYSSSVDTVAAGKTVGFFGDFKSGYIVGVRGGAGVNIKILDQPKALEGLLTILGYQRVDGRVRRSEAIQELTLA